MTLRFTPATTFACAALAPLSAFAVDYLSAEQAAKLMFPEADHFEQQAVTLSAGELQQLASAGVTPRSAQWSVRAAKHGAQTLGWVVTDGVVGKFELIDYAVGVNVDGSVRQIEVLSYRESHGQEIRLPAWRKQFAGKTAAAPIKVGDDIANISGATLSCTHVTDGVRRIVHLVDVLKRDGRLA